MVRITSGNRINQVQTETALKQEGVKPTPKSAIVKNQERVHQIGMADQDRFLKSGVKATAQKIQVESTFFGASLGTRRSAPEAATPALGIGQLGKQFSASRLFDSTQSLFKERITPLVSVSSLLDVKTLQTPPSLNLQMQQMIKPMTAAEKILKMNSLLQQIQRMYEQITVKPNLKHQIAVNSIKNLRP